MSSPKHTTRRGWIVAAGLAAGLAIAGTALSTPSTFSGKNGRLLYQGQVGAHTQLFTIKADGTGRRQLTHFGDSDSLWASWSPDGRRIAFERDFADHGGIYTMNADGSGLRALRTGLVGQPTWSPDGAEITFGRYIPGKEASIWIMGASGGDVRRVTTNPLPKNDGCGGCAGQGSSVFSPNGKRIAFTWIKGGHSGAISTVGVDGTGLRQLTPFRRGVADKIDWSPDGSRIAFSSPEFGRAGASSNVYTIRPDGSGLRQLTHNRGGTINAGADSWSPDGTKIAYVSNKSGSYQIWTMNADGSGATQLTRGPEAHLAAWGSHP
jgi:TolB protein